MALGATIYVFDIRFADADRNVYETLSLRVARHPSETPEYLITRVLAYCLEYTEGIAFSSGGLSDPDVPALAVRDLTGALRSWIEVGTPDAARLHKASKAAPRVSVYVHRNVDTWLAKLQGEKIYCSDEIEIYAIDSEVLSALAARLERRMDMDLSLSDRFMYASLGGETLAGVVTRHTIGAA